MSIITVIPDDLSIPEFLKRKDTAEQIQARRKALMEKMKHQRGHAPNRRLEMTQTVGPKEAQRKEMRVNKTTGKVVEHKPTLSELAGIVASGHNTGKNGHAVKANMPKADPPKKFAETTAPLGDKTAEALRARKPKKSRSKVAEALAETKSVKELKVRAKKLKKAEAQPGTKQALIIEMLKRKSGCTTAEVLKATGWPAVSMPQQARQGHVKLKKVKEGKVLRYYAA